MPKDNLQGRAKAKGSTVKNVNSLTLAFAKAVAKHQDDKSDNLVVSPYNALTCLSMAAQGSAKNTREEFARTLFGASAKELDEKVADLAALNADILAANQGQVELKTANGIWANKELLTLNKTFAAEMKKTFGAEISDEKFSDPTVPAKINDWASKNTNGLITKVIDELGKDDFAVLASALYFKGQWTNKFDKSKTEDLSFTTDDGKNSLTPTMKKFFSESQVKYQDGSDYEAIALTYGQDDRKEGKNPTMRIILARPKDESVSARDWLTAQTAPAWLEPYSFDEVRGSVELPRMDIKQNFKLIPALKEMGIRDAFLDGIADFSPMTKEGSKELIIGKVTHDTVFKTDEEGSEAAAVTTIGMIRCTSVAPPVQTIDVKFDRSFVFALQDISTGAVLFIGAVNKPNDDMKPVVKKGPKLAK